MLRRIACGIAVAVTVAGLCAAPASAAEDHSTYYLALGDSLAAGVQPTDPEGTGGMGYVPRLYDTLRAGEPGLVLANYGCPGETTGTMLAGTACPDAYPGYTSQIDAAVAFLARHAGDVSLVTLDIGANDLAGCVAGTGIDTTCVTRALAGVATNLGRILLRLRAVAPHTRMVAMTYYDPYLVSWLTGPDGATLADQSLRLAGVLNGILATGYTLAGFRVADVAGAFSTNDTTAVEVPGFGSLPLNVARICTWTWMCVTMPPDIHANETGYRVITSAFLAEL